jgi:hypothetical protein
MAWSEEKKIPLCVGKEDVTLILLSHPETKKNGELGK